MLTAGYVFLSVGAALSCYFAFAWLGTERRRSVILSLLRTVRLSKHGCENERYYQPAVFSSIYSHCSGA